ncbi:hypothetical protein Q3G72_010066 [Acer saccharum]|nr:hypothetical protein Q3G72_010066 [Acer saccharum]
MTVVVKGLTHSRSKIEKLGITIGCVEEWNHIWLLKSKSENRTKHPVKETKEEASSVWAHSPFHLVVLKNGMNHIWVQLLGYPDSNPESSSYIDCVNDPQLSSSSSSSSSSHLHFTSLHFNTPKI